MYITTAAVIFVTYFIFFSSIFFLMHMKSPFIIKRTVGNAIMA